jgi:hypothetical protein
MSQKRDPSTSSGQAPGHSDFSDPLFPGWLGVVALAGLDVERSAVLAACDLDVAIGAVSGAVGWGVRKLILAAQLALNGGEGGLHFAAVAADLEKLAACGANEFLHGAVVGFLDDAVEAGVLNEKNIRDCVGSLCRFDRGVEVRAAAFIDAVCEQDEGLASCLRAQLLRGGEGDGIVEHGAPGLADGRDGSVGVVAGRGVDLRVVDGLFQIARTGGEVGKHGDVDVEGNEEGFVFRMQDVAQETQWRRAAPWVERAAG